jgi:hypothetical protein
LSFQLPAKQLLTVECVSPADGPGRKKKKKNQHDREKVRPDVSDRVGLPLSATDTICTYIHTYAVVYAASAFENPAAKKSGPHTANV